MATIHWEVLLKWKIYTIYFSGRHFANMSESVSNEGPEWNIILAASWCTYDYIWYVKLERNLEFVGILILHRTHKILCLRVKNEFTVFKEMIIPSKWKILSNTLLYFSAYFIVIIIFHSSLYMVSKNSIRFQVYLHSLV